MRIIIEMTRAELAQFNCPSERVSSWVWQMIDGKVEPILPSGVENLSRRALADKGLDIDVIVDLKLKR